MFIEENKNIKDELKMRLVFPDSQIINYIYLWKLNNTTFTEKLECEFNIINREINVMSDIWLSLISVC